MDETQIRTLEEVERFLCGAGQARPILQGSKDDSYAWIERTLVRFGYMLIDRKGKGIVRRYIMELSGYSRQQITRLISQYRKSGHIRRQRTVKGFERKYTPADIQLLAMVDRLVDDVPAQRRKLIASGRMKFSTTSVLSGWLVFPCLTFTICAAEKSISVPGVDSRKPKV